MYGAEEHISMTSQVSQLIQQQKIPYLMKQVTLEIIVLN